MSAKDNAVISKNQMHHARGPRGLLCRTIFITTGSSRTKKPNNDINITKTQYRQPRENQAVLEAGSDFSFSSFD